MKNIIQFLQTGGVPLTNDLMSAIQEAYSIYEVLGDVAGDKTILKGCEINGSSINSGIVAINGEILPFEGGLLSSTVYIFQEDILETFQDQTDKVLINKRSVRFGNSSVVYNWSDFVRIDTLKQLKEQIALKASQIQVNDHENRLAILEMKTAPIINGGIVMAWRKPVDQIPAGWKECIDLRGKTIVGCDPNDSTFSTLGDNIGEKTHQLTPGELPTITGTWQTIAHSSENGSGVVSTTGAAPAIIGGGPTSFYHKILKIQFGSNTPHNNIQPSRIVNFIEPNL